MTAKMEYADYLTKIARIGTKTAQEFNKENIVREVGKSYGCSEMEMDEAVKATIH